MSELEKQETPVAEKNPAEETKAAQEAETPAEEAAGHETPDNSASEVAKENATDLPEQTKADKKPTDVTSPAQTPDARLINAELRAAAALAGVPAERIQYVIRSADMSGANDPGADLSALAAAAVNRVICDVPEFKGTASAPDPIGSKGAFKRKPVEQPKDAFLRGLTASKD